MKRGPSVLPPAQEDNTWDDDEEDERVFKSSQRAASQRIASQVPVRPVVPPPPIRQPQPTLIRQPQQALPRQHQPALTRQHQSAVPRQTQSALLRQPPVGGPVRQPYRPQQQQAAFNAPNPNLRPAPRQQAVRPRTQGLPPQTRQQFVQQRPLRSSLPTTLHYSNQQRPPVNSYAISQPRKSVSSTSVQTVEEVFDNGPMKYRQFGVQMDLMSQLRNEYRKPGDKFHDAFAKFFSFFGLKEREEDESSKIIVIP